MAMFENHCSSRYIHTHTHTHTHKHTHTVPVTGYFKATSPYHYPDQIGRFWFDAKILNILDDFMETELNTWNFI